MENISQAKTVKELLSPFNVIDDSEIFDGIEPEESDSERKIN